MPIRFITFGAGDHAYIDAGNRLVGQARTTGLFDDMAMYTAEYLERRPDFWEKHSEFIRKYPKGFGYWLWKPYIIQQTMREMEDGDVIMYLDCGCEIDVRKKEIIREYLTDYVKSDLIIGSVGLKECEWNKQDLVSRIGVNTPDDLETKQYQAGALLMLVCNQTRKLVDEWYEIGSNNYHYIDDSPSQIPNHPHFKEHRHDQAIFSLLAKKYRLYSSRRLCSAIEYIRNRTGKSVLA